MIMVSENIDKVPLPAFYDKHPEVKAKLVEYLKTIPPEEKQKHAEDFKKYLNGEMTWGEIRKITKRMQREIARVAYLKFQMKDYAGADSLFKGLAILDHTNWYYRAALGAIYQKQKMYEDAVLEYTAALSLKEIEISSLVNRGECYMWLGRIEEARADCHAALQIPNLEKNPWHVRAKILLKRIELLEKGEGK